MTLSLEIDESGRITLPDTFREKLHLHEGSKLNARLKGNTLELSGASEDLPEQETLCLKDGLPVLKGWSEFDAVGAIKESRDSRLQSSQS